MVARKITRKTPTGVQFEPQFASADVGLPEEVDADIAAGTVVYWAGEQRAGTVVGVPYRLALYWMRQRWATSISWDPTG